MTYINEISYILQKIPPFDAVKLEKILDRDIKPSNQLQLDNHRLLKLISQLETKNAHVQSDLCPLNIDSCAVEQLLDQDLKQFYHSLIEEINPCNNAKHVSSSIHNLIKICQQKKIKVLNGKSDTELISELNSVIDELPLEYTAYCFITKYINYLPEKVHIYLKRAIFAKFLTRSLVESIFLFFPYKEIDYKKAWLQCLETSTDLEIANISASLASFNLLSNNIININKNTDNIELFIDDIIDVYVHKIKLLANTVIKHTEKIDCNRFWLFLFTLFSKDLQNEQILDISITKFPDILFSQLFDIFQNAAISIGFPSDSVVAAVLPKLKKHELYLYYKWICTIFSAVNNMDLVKKSLYWVLNFSDKKTHNTNYELCLFIEKYKYFYTLLLATIAVCHVYSNKIIKLTNANDSLVTIIKNHACNETFKALLMSCLLPPNSYKKVKETVTSLETITVLELGILLYEYPKLISNVAIEQGVYYKSFNYLQEFFLEHVLNDFRQAFYKLIETQIRNQNYRTLITQKLKNKLFCAAKNLSELNINIITKQDIECFLNDYTNLPHISSEYTKNLASAIHNTGCFAKLLQAIKDEYI